MPQDPTRPAVEPEPQSPAAPAATPPPVEARSTLGGAAYDILRSRLLTQSSVLRERLATLDQRRQAVFGSIEFKLLQADRITTEHNCIPRDMVALGQGSFLFGFNVSFGLKKEVELQDVFSCYERDPATGNFKLGALDAIKDRRFLVDFKRLYSVYSKTVFSKFSVVEASLFLVFQIGDGVKDIAVFKWALSRTGLVYVGGGVETEFREIGFPAQFDFEWKTPNRESFRYGEYPHVSIEDRVFVECIGGDLTIKIEDNTATGEGIYSEAVVDRYQKVDDAELQYARVGHLILLRIRPYKETEARHFIFNEKLQEAMRVDSLGHSCALLPEDHGLIFPDGFYLATGELKLFESREAGMILERVVHAPNGEDSLYVFYDNTSGQYVLMPYRLISQTVPERLVCHGFSLFEQGHLLLFRADAEPQKHHTAQLRQTPFHLPGYEPTGDKTAFLYQVGNKEVVRALAECHEILTLVNKDKPYAQLYVDLVKRCTACLDSYPWFAHDESCGINEALALVRDAADQAVEEFEKVRRLQRDAVLKVSKASKRCEDQFQAIRRASFRTLDDFTQSLSSLRHLRGELISLKELRYADLAQVEASEKAVILQTEQLSSSCVQFLLQPSALDANRTQAAGFAKEVAGINTVAQGRKLEALVAGSGAGLELLIETVNGLQIEDATEATRIIDGITGVYATLNQVKAALHNHLKGLMSSEGSAQFAAQMKLLSQSAASYLDLCDSPSKCDEYLNRVTVQLEELEGTFAGFDAFTVELADRRAALYEAFEQRKVALIEQRNRKAAALQTAADRILKVVQNRLAGFRSTDDIHSYMASDPMIAKVRDLVRELLEMQESVKADELQGKLKSAQQEAVRQLKDRQDLVVGGANVIQLGRHRFNLNTQPLDLTLIQRNQQPHIHLTSTQFFEPVRDEAYLATRDSWDQELVSENPEVYRAEYLAFCLLRSLESSDPGSIEATLSKPEDAALALVHGFTASRYQEGYTKGVHDEDGARIFKVLATSHVSLKLARHAPSARACGVIYWRRFCPKESHSLWAARLRGHGARRRAFPGQTERNPQIAQLKAEITAFLQQTSLFPVEIAGPAAEYLVEELSLGDQFVVTQESALLEKQFQKDLVRRGLENEFEAACESLRAHPASEFELIRDWAGGFLLTQPDRAMYLDELAALLFCGDAQLRYPVSSRMSEELKDMKGSHARLRDGVYAFNYLEFMQRLEHFQSKLVPRFEAFQQTRQALLDRERARLRLGEFKPKVLSSFMRNQLVDEVYLPLVGDNLAKQIGVAGEQKRTDLMGLLLLISPPGYGKTTLMEYVASRLGIVFIKINGPALGHQVTSLDPAEAPNAAARQEILKLNLALEMGDNVMLCVDDIQHCNPEFLQKFISLCDGQRKIEGVWEGRSKTYDLRGRKMVVVMAGNPYTETGQKFKLPDMLTNRADTYNLGDILGGREESFKASYLENAITSNPVLAPLANRSQKDIRTFIRMGEPNASPEPLEGSYTPQEIEEILAVMRHLLRIREVVLKVNQEYIRSAAQADEFRTEPPFRLQGSYRNMNRMAEKVAAIMNAAEVGGLILDHYRSESQTLATGAEANLLKFKELLELMDASETARWAEIKRTFQRNQVSRGADGADPVGRLVAQLSAFQHGLESIQQTLHQGLKTSRAPEVSVTERVDRLHAELTVLHSTLASLKDVSRQQRDTLQSSLDLLAARARQGTVEFELTQEMLANERVFLDRIREIIAGVPNRPSPPHTTTP